MGHYDNVYDEEEAHELEELNRRRKARMVEMKVLLHKKIDDLDDDEIKFMKEVFDNLTAYRGFFTILDRKR